MHLEEIVCHNSRLFFTIKGKLSPHAVGTAIIMIFQSTTSSTFQKASLFSLVLVLSLFISPCWAITPKDSDNISLQSILKPEQQKHEEAYAIGGIDTYTAEKRPTTNANGNLWQVVLALLAVSAGAWWILNTAWFKALAQQKEAQLLQKNGTFVPYATTPSVPVATPSPLSKGLDWVASFLHLETNKNPITNNPSSEVAFAEVLQTLPLPGGQYLVVIKTGEVLQSLVTGGQQPLLLGTWSANSNNPWEESPSAEKWMAHPPPTPTPISAPAFRKEEVNLQAEILTDYEALSETEEALFGQLLHTEKTTI